MLKNNKKIAKSLDYSKRKNSNYFVTSEDGTKIHFGGVKYEDYLIHSDENIREKYLARAKKIKNRTGELTGKNPESANYWSTNLLW